MFDNSDINFDKAEPPLSIFNGLRKDFLLDKQASRKNNAGVSQRHQSEPPRSQFVPATQAKNTPIAPAKLTKRTIKEEILHELGHLTGTYGPASGEGSSPIPWIEISGFFHRIEAWLLQKCQEGESQALERVERAAKRIEETAEKLQNVKPTLSYAQAARAGYAQTTPAQNSPLPIPPKEEKSVIVKITNKEEEKNIKSQSRKDIAQRIQHAAGGSQAAHTVLAVRQLKSGDLAVHMDSAAGKREMEEKKEWIKAIAASAETRKKTWPVMAHGAKVADFPLNEWEKQAKRLCKENAKLHPDLQIRGLRWLSRPDGKNFSTLIIETGSAEQANRMIREGVIMGYDLKSVERYDTRCRITQCFKCHKYGHISSICLNAEKCGFCGEGHPTESCAVKSQESRMKCAGCNGGNHTAWSKLCPARIKELGRAKAARLVLPTLFPVGTVAQFIKKTFTQMELGRSSSASQDTSMRRSGASQETNVRLSGASQASEVEALEAPKKRKLNPIGRPKGSLNKAKTLSGSAAPNSSILDFTFSPSQTSQASGSLSAGEKPANNNAPEEDSTMNGTSS